MSVLGVFNLYSFAVSNAVSTELGLYITGGQSTRLERTGMAKLQNTLPLIYMSLT